MSNLRVKDLVTKSADLDSLIAELKAEGKTRQERLFLAAVSALNHALTHGDVRKLTDLYHAFSKAENPNEFRFWVSVFSKRTIGWDKDAESFTQKSGKKVQGAAKVTETIDHNGTNLVAIKTPWWNMKEVEKNRDFDPDKDVKSVVGNLKSHARKASEAGQEELAELYTSMAKNLLNNIDANEEKYSVSKNTIISLTEV